MMWKKPEAPKNSDDLIDEAAALNDQARALVERSEQQREQAHHKLRVANDLYEKAIKEKGDAQRELLTKAAMVLNQARQLDPNAEVPYISDVTKQPTTMSMDRFAALILYTQSFEDLKNLQYRQHCYKREYWFCLRDKMNAMEDRWRAYKKALATITKAIQFEPDQPMHHTQLARIHLARGYEQKAREALNEALKLNPDHLDAHSILATI